jgi:hypothetical protein
MRYRRLTNIEGQVTHPLTIISAVMPQVLQRPRAAYERQNRLQAPPRGAPGLLRTSAGIGPEPAELEPSPDPRKGPPGADLGAQKDQGGRGAGIECVLQSP